MASVVITHPELKKGRNSLEVRIVPDGFEFKYGKKWYAAKDGLISPLMFTPAQQGEKSK